MADRDDIATRAALAAGKDVVRRAVDDLLTSEEDEAAREAERKPASKSRRNTIIGFGVVGLLIVVGVIGMVVSYWQYFLLLGLAGLGGIYGWYRLRKRFRAKEDAKATVEARVERGVVGEPRVADGEAEAARDALLARQREADEARALEEARAREEARAVEEQSIDDELAAMKARLRD